jgi:hypothetical protein
MLGGRELSLPTTGESVIGQERAEFNIEQIAHRQIGARLGIPAAYYDRLQSPEGKLTEEQRQELKRLLDTNVNALFRLRPETRMVRTFKGEPEGIARAFLSDSYRRRDNDELAEHILPILGQIPEVKIESCALTDTRFYLKAITPRVFGEVGLDDVVQAGVVIRNSEVGHGALSVQPLVFRLKCLNGMILAESTRHYHVGRHVEAEEGSTRVFRDETMKLDDAAFFAKLGDVVKAAVDETNFAAIVAQMREAKTGETIEKPKQAIEKLSKRFTLSEAEGESVLKHLTEGGDLSAFGALNAVTRASQDVESYERATELEAVGGQILAMAGTPDWRSIAS